MWEVQKYVMRAKRVIVHNDWECDDGKIVSGKSLQGFLETCADLANNKTAIMACGIPSICKATGLSRSTVIRCLAIARRHRFLIDTGKRLPAPYDTIMYKMDPWVFLRLGNGYLDTYYESVEEVMADLDLDYETASLLHFQHDVYGVIAGSLNERFWRSKGRDMATEEEWDKAMRKVIDHPGFYWREKPAQRWWTAAQRREAFLKVGCEMGLGFNPATPNRPWIMQGAAPAEVAA